MLEIIEKRVGNGNQRRHHAHAIVALPVAVLRSDCIGDRTMREIVGAAASRGDCCSGRQSEYRRERAHVGVTAHGKGDDAIGREHSLQRIGELEEKLSRIAHVQCDCLDVGLASVRLIAEAGCVG